MRSNINTKCATLGSRYKLRMNTPKYYIHSHNGTVTCVIECKMLGLPYIPKIAKQFFDNNECFRNYDFKVKGIAKCSPGDTYDEQKGLRIAESKAKLKALKKAEKIMEAYRVNVILEMSKTEHSISFFEEEYRKEYCHHSKLVK